MTGAADIAVRAHIATLCSAMPGAEMSEPFGPGTEIWKVGGKIFAALGQAGAGVTVKTPDTDTAAMLIEIGVATRAPYFHGSWVRLPLTTPRDELRHRIATSYDIIRAALPKRVQAALPATGH